jgi:isopentenyl-diphosphate delta-isomerase type 1
MPEPSAGAVDVITGAPPAAVTEVVVLLDPKGRPSGTALKAGVHHAATPLHLAFSCHVVDDHGRVLLTRRAATKRTWPATWTNACCGHPAPGETLRVAVTRRLDHELGLQPHRLGLALPDFAYRAAMADGTVEHELCPVAVAEVSGRVEPVPDPAEVDDLEWVPWEALVDRARTRPATLSPWAVAQIARLAALAPSPRAWLDAHLTGPTPVGALGLDRPITLVHLRPPRPPSPPPSPPAGADDPLAVVRGPVERVLQDFLAEQERAAAALDPAVTQLSREVRRLVEAGGKRLRPAFVYWGHRAAGGADDDGVFTAAAAVELLHTFALIHDDVMDRSVRRRGRPTAEQSLAETHRSEALNGDDAWFGVSGALLAGDLAFVWADQLLETTPLPPVTLAAARQVFTRLRTEVIGGQYLDVRLAHRPTSAGPEGDAEAAALRVALLKSARYTVTRPLELGAALAGGARCAASLAAYGDAVGLAFQLRDDVLGMFGDPAVTGKSCRDDLREGKRTLLVLRALRLADGPDRRLLERSLGDPQLDEDTARRCCRIVAASGALASVEALIDAQQAVALHAIAALDGPPAAALTHLATLATRRDR